MPSPRTKLRRKRIRFRALPASNLPKVIPPRTMVILSCVDSEKTPDWHADRGRIFRIGYYNREDGLDCIWLVNEAAEYEQTTDRESLLKHFVILKLSNETDYFGDSRAPLKPLNTRRKPAFVIPSMVR